MAETGGRTELLAIVFCHQIDAARYLNTLGEEAAGALQTKVRELLAQVVVSHEGRVVKNIGDGVMATFHGASQALDASIAMQQLVTSSAANGDLHPAVALEVGISVGDVTVHEDDCHGTPVVEAARLQYGAGPGGILCTDLTKLLAGGRSQAVFEAPEAVEAKGFDDPIPSWVVGWAPNEPGGFGLPEGLAAGGRYPFVGRVAQLNDVGRLWDRSLGGEMTGVLVAGEPGVGKSRLAREFGLQAIQDGDLVLYGRCDEGLGVPFQPFAKAFSQYIDAVNGSDRSQGPLAIDDLGRYPGELRRLAPRLSDVVADLPNALEADGETAQYRLFAAVLSWLETTSRSVPVVLVIDDFQWATAPTLSLLRYLLQSDSTARVCIVGTYRNTELDNHEALGKFLADVGALSTVETVSLGGLDDAGVVELLAGADVVTKLGLDDHTSSDLAKRLVAQTAGNPFFLAELVNVVEEAGMGGLDRAHSSALGEVVIDRVSRLTTLERDMLDVASMAGSAIQPELLVEVLGVSPSMGQRALDEIVHSGLLLESTEPPTLYRFQHDLVRSTLYESMSLGRRAQRHHELAHAIEKLYAESLDDHLDDLAYHYPRSQEPEDVDRGVEVCRWAGEASMVGLGFDRAVEHFEAALELCDRYGSTLLPETRCQLLLSLGGAMRRAGTRGARRMLIQAADEAAAHGDHATVVQAALANTRGFFSSAGRTDTDRVRLLEMAIDAVGEEDSSHRARLLANLSVELTFGTELERRQRLSDESLAIANRLDHPPTVAHVLNQRIGFFWNANGLPQRLQLCEQFRTVARELGMAQWTFSAASSQFQAAMEAGDMKLADRCLAEMVHDFGELRQPLVESYLRMRQSVRNIVAGDLAEGERLALACYQLAESAGQPDALTFYAGQLFNLRFHQGRLHELQDIFADAAENQTGIPAMRAALAVIYCETDQLALARPIFQDLADGSDVLLHDLSWLVTMCLLAESCFQLGDTGRAELLHSQLKPYRHQCVDNATNWFGLVGHYLGMLEHLGGSYAEADASFQEAVDTHRAMPAPILLARTRLDWARSLLDRPDQEMEPEMETARELLTAAHREAARLGLATIERRASDLLDF